MTKNPRTTRRFVLMAAVLGSLAGCAGAPVPGSYTLGKFVELNPQAPAAGRVTMSPSVLWEKDTEGDGSFIAVPVAEGALTLQPVPQYSVALSLANNRLTAEGNLFLLNGPLRLGIIHGLGGGYMKETSGNASTDTSATAFDLLGGLFAQVTTGTTALFFGARYTFDKVTQTTSSSLAGTSMSSDKDSKGHHVVGSLGAAFRSSRLTLMPEVVIARGFYPASTPMGKDSGGWYVLPTLTVAADF